jgi:hypothetical protein
MMDGITEFLGDAFPLLAQILNAGNAITAFSLGLYSLTFNPRERAARLLTLLLACVGIVYAADVMAGTASQASEKLVWLRMQWVGISFVPAAYMHLSDALLAATGRPSRGRRKWVIRIGYVLSAVSLAAAGLTPHVVRDLRSFDSVAYLAAGPYFVAFLGFFALSLAFTGMNLWRAYRRCLTIVSRRRMRYLIVGAVAPSLAAFPFLTTLGSVVPQLPLLTWTILSLTNAAVAVQLVLITYAVAYFGVSFPDRVVKSRLFQWLLRGPIVASTALAVVVVVGRVSLTLGLENSRAVPFFMVATILGLQFVITLVRPTIERLIFYGQDRHDVSRLHALEERLLTTGDLKQYLESILNASCDISGAPSAFVAVVGKDGIELEVSVGPEDPLRGSEDLPPILMTEDRLELNGFGPLFRWDHYWLAPLYAPESADLVGVLGLWHRQRHLDLEPDEIEALALLRERATVALADRTLQREVFSAVDRLVPLVDQVQRFRSAARYGGVEALISPVEALKTEADLSNLVKQALGHYWGGPRLTQSPLLSLQVVRSALEEHEGNAANALRSILRRAIDQVRPRGERRFTAEWMLYNILEMKFLEGRKVRDVAMRLAMSEADLYRKQKVAIESVARAMADMEREAQLAAKN